MEYNVRIKGDLMNIDQFEKAVPLIKTIKTLKRQIEILNCPTNKTCVKDIRGNEYSIGISTLKTIKILTIADLEAQLSIVENELNNI